MRIIHFSDFHLSANQEERARTIVKRLINALVVIHQERPIDLILFSGDLIDKAGKGFPSPSLRNALNMFQDIVICPIVNTLGIPRNRFIFTLGNHEINRDIIKDDEDKELTESLKNLENIDWYVHQPALEIPRILDYNNFRDEYWDVQAGDTEIKKNLFQFGIKLNIGEKKIGVNCLNTAWRCLDNNDEHKILTGKFQITDMRNFFEDCHLRFAIGHHHPVFMNQFETPVLKEVIGYNYDAYFCGHTHDTEGEYVERAKGSCFYFTAPGTLSSNVSATQQYRNGFMIIDYEQDNRYVETQCYYQNDNEDFIRDNNYADKGIWHQQLPGSTIVRPMAMSLFLQKEETEFLRNDTINNCIKELINKDNKSIQLVALSGIGKTRIIREAFDDKVVHANYYYCEFSDKEAGLLYDIDEILLKHKGEEGLIVLDNCPNALIRDIIMKRDSYSSLFRIIGVNNEYYDRNNIGGGIVKQIVLTQDLMRDTVNKYVDDKIPIINGDTSTRDQIKRIADGFPGMAILLVKAYYEEKDVNVHIVDHLVTKLLKFDDGQKKDEEIVMRSLALFQPCPYKGIYKGAYEFIRNNEIITPLYRRSEEEKRHLFKQTINKHDSSLIEITESWLNVRPFPLAVWLVDKWFSDDDDEERMVGIVESIESLEKPLYEVIKNGLYKRLAYMQESVPAKDLMNRLTNGPTAPFCNEKVVCSDLGSRLFLAMSSVNPGAIAECLYTVLLPKSIIWIKEYVSGDIRRNLVWALEKLCFSKESYQHGCKVMALLAVAENEEWGNNASGQFKKLFHIFLPGTEVNLEERLNTLQYLKKLGEDYKELLLESIDRAFDNGHFVRDGSAAQFGLEKKEDYIPTNKEIVEYWMACSNMLQELLDEDEAIVNRIAQIAVNHVLKWSFDGMLARLFPLLTKVANVKGGIWQEMYDAMVKTDRKHITFYPKEFLDQLDAYKVQIRPKFFNQKLKDVRPEFYKDYDIPIEKQLLHEREVFLPLAKEFIEKGFYKSYEEIKQIAEDKEYFDIWFSSALYEIMTDEQVRDVLEICLKIIEDGGGDTFSSSFVFRLCYVFRMRNEVREFMRKILQKGYNNLFIKLLSHCETEQYDSYKIMKDTLAKGELEQCATVAYLEYVSVTTNSQLTDIIKMFYSDYPELTIPLMKFVIRHQLYRIILNDSEVLTIVKKVVLKYPITENMDNPSYEYARYVTMLLENYHDNEFAVKLNRKIMETLKEKLLLHSYFEGVYRVLIKQYMDVIWADFEKAFQSSDYSLFVYQIKDEIGSGTGFGVGPLFQICDEKVKDLCMKNPKFAPSLVAEMCPIFSHGSDDESEGIRFDDWVLWLLDQFGDLENVLEGLHANMGSFAWTGSVIPLLLQKKECLEKIRKHKRPEVREWVELCLQEVKDSLSHERDREEYMRLHYN